MIPGRKAAAYLEDITARDDDEEMPFPWAYAGLAFLALLVLIGSLAITQRVDTRAEAAHVGYGYPLHFVQTNNSSFWGAPGGPQGPFTASLNPMEDQAHLQLGHLVLDWGVVTLLLWTPLWLYRRRRV